MADSLQMMDLVSLSKNFTRLRDTDPQQRAAAHQLAEAAAVRDLDALHQEVTETEEAQEARRRDRQPDGGGTEDEQHPSRQPRHPPEPVPEQNEGHLLNLKA